ncbi:MAG: UMP kinase [Clostridia bacterium]|nr:UMP kinase [Clostridia bacterium]
MEPKYKRVLLKLSGEVMSGESGFGIDRAMVDKVCDQIKKVVDMGVEVAIVVGGGNFWRGRKALDMERATADYMGMLATTMNSMALQDALEAKGVPTRVQLAIEIKQVGEPFILRRAIRHLEKGRVVIFGGGTGNPYFTTDTAAVLRATEIDAQIVLFGKTVDGVYDSDPDNNPNAVKFDTITYSEILNKNLKVIDSTAASLARDNKMPMAVFELAKEENIIKVLCGENPGTLVNE